MTSAAVGSRVRSHVDAGPSMGERERLLAKDGALAGAWPQAEGREGRRVQRGLLSVYII